MSEPDKKSLPSEKKAVLTKKVADAVQREVRRQYDDMRSREVSREDAADAVQREVRRQYDDMRSREVSREDATGVTVNGVWEGVEKVLKEIDRGE